VNGRYQGLGYEGRAAVLDALAHGDEVHIVETILGAAEGSEEPDWVESAALALTRAFDDQLRRAGLLALGVLVRRFSGRVDLAAVRGAAERLASEPRLSGTASDLLDDIEVFGEDLRPPDIDEPEA
jgi:hypothetical protein